MKSRTRQRKLWVEAAMTLAFAQLGVKLLPASKLLAWAARPPRNPHRFADPDLPLLVASAVDSIGFNSWMKAACLPRALAVQAMLRRRGIASRLCLGVARDGEALSAHAWIELGQDVVIGGTDRRFTRIVEFG